jgi:hypothetical protein
MDKLTCPDCKTELNQNFGLLGITLFCNNCKKEWVKMLNELVSREQFHERVAAER